MLMKARLLLTLALCSLVGPLGTSVGASAASRALSHAPSATGKRTYIYLRGKKTGFYGAWCHRDRYVGAYVCAASWTPGDEGEWAAAWYGDRGVWTSGFAGVVPKHVDCYARWRTPRFWRVSCGGPGLPVTLRGASLRFHSRGRWDIYKSGKMIALAKGANPIPTGLMWLARPPH